MGNDLTSFSLHCPDFMCENRLGSFTFLEPPMVSWPLLPVMDFRSESWAICYKVETEIGFPQTSKHTTV